MTGPFVKKRLLVSAGASGPFDHPARPGPAAMTTSAAIVRRTAFMLMLAPVLFARPAVAQSSQVSLADAGHRFMSPNMEAFEARRKTGMGQFIPDSTLRAASGSRLSYVLAQHLNGIVVGNGGPDGDFPISSRVCNGLACSAPRCYARIYIDGMEVFDGTPQQRNAAGVDLSRFKPEDLSGVEYYGGPAGVPARYAGLNSDCGTLLFWSRDR